MSRELLKEIAEVFRERRGGITWVAEPLLDKIEAELAKPEPEPVAWMSKTFPTTFATSRDIAQPAMFFTPLYARQPDQSERIANLENELARICDIHTEAMGKYHGLEQQLADQSARIAELIKRLRIAEDVIFASKMKSDCKTADDWKRKAEWYEYNWRTCSEGFNAMASDLKRQLAELRAKNDELENALEASSALTLITAKSTLNTAL